MSDIPAIKRQLKIKTGVVARLEKETGLYKKEADTLEKKLNKFIANNAEDWDINNTRRMMHESEKMVIDTKTRLDKAATELQDLVEKIKTVSELVEAEEFTKAKEIVDRLTA